MPKRKPTKHEDDILRSLRQPERYDPKARSIGGPWRMVKCKDGAYVCYEQHLEIIDNLRKSAEINPAQSPHDGIHTCSKRCKKPGCNRGLRDTIEEQDAQIEALKQDLLEQSAAARHLRMERIHDLNQIGGLQEENARLKADFHQAHDERADYAKDVSKLKAEVEALMTTPCSRLLRAEREEVTRLKAEVERIEPELEQRCRELNLSLGQQAIQLRQIGELKAEVERLTQEYSDATNHYNKLHNDLEAEVERLRKAGDAMTEVIWLSGCVSGMEIKERTVKAWQAAKEGKPSV